MYLFPACFPPVWTHRMHASDELYVLSSGNSGLMDNFQRQQSVWNLVKENVPCSELPEIRAVLGETLIDTYTELYSEVNKSYLCIRLSSKTQQKYLLEVRVADI